ncbi:MAG: cytochrome b5 domain-containing protein [bacterium]
MPLLIKMFLSIVSMCVLYCSQASSLFAVENGSWAAPASVAPASVPLAPETISQTGSYSMFEINKHHTPYDCWLLLDQQIYDVTSYLSGHPGGSGEIEPYCGLEATQAFATKGSEGEAHSFFAKMLLKKYYLGKFTEKEEAAY